jgi:hypothetical protein
MFYRQASIHHNRNTRCSRTLRCRLVTHAELHPNQLRSFANHLVNMTANKG